MKDKRKTKYTIEAYLRIKVDSRITSFFKKERCEYCGGTDELHVHHNLETKFSKIVAQALNILNMQYRSQLSEYSEKEVENLTIVVLGLHLYARYKILCKNCHIDEHKEGGYRHVDYRLIVAKNKEKYEWYKAHTLHKDNIDPENFYNHFNKRYIEKSFNKKFISNKFFKSDHHLITDIFKNLLKEELRKKLIENDINASFLRKIASISKINRILEIYNLPFLVRSIQETRGTRRGEYFWKIETIGKEVNIKTNKKLVKNFNNIKRKGK